MSEFESLDLLGVESGAPDQARLANDAILALYGPSNDSILSGIPRETCFGNFASVLA